MEFVGYKPVAVVELAGIGTAVGIAPELALVAVEQVQTERFHRHLQLRLERRFHCSGIAVAGLELLAGTADSYEPVQMN